MATSGTVTYRPTVATVIAQALTIVGAIDPDAGGSPTSAQSTDALTTINMLLKHWEANGLQLWETQYGVIFPVPNQAVFKLGSPGPAGDNACISEPLGMGFVQTTLSADAALGASTIDVESISGVATTAIAATTMATGYFIGIQLDDGSMQWTTINGAPSGTTVTLTAALTDSASAGNYVYSYQTKMIRPLRILDGFLRQAAGGNDIPVMILSREEYNRFGMKQSIGSPIQLYYDPQENTGYLYMYPVFPTCDQIMYIQFQSPIEDIGSTSEDFDLPQEWAQALTWQLAYLLAPKYEVAEIKFKMIKTMADDFFRLLDSWDQEAASVFIQPLEWPYSNGR